MENGRLLGFIGVISSILQGTYVRRRKGNSTSLLSRGLITCCASLSLLALLPLVTSMSAGAEASRRIPPFIVLYGAAAGLAFVSASVVNSLNSLASLECSSSAADPRVTGAKMGAKGKALGRFRSYGQLGRAAGPLVSTSIYFMYGPGFSYAFGAVGCGVIALYSLRFGKEERRKLE